MLQILFFLIGAIISFVLLIAYWWFRYIFSVFKWAFKSIISVKF